MLGDKSCLSGLIHGMVVGVLSGWSLLSSALLAQATPEDFTRSATFRQWTSGKVFRSRVEPQWYAEDQFWYRVDVAADSWEFIRVDAASATRELAFDHAAVAQKLGELTNSNVNASALPIDRLGFGEGFVEFRSADVWYRWTAATGELIKIDEPSTSQAQESREQGERRGRGRFGRRPPRNVSPDEKWEAFVRDHNLWLKNRETNEEFALTSDGVAGDAYGENLFWSPDSSSAIVMRTKEVSTRQIHLIESRPSEQLQPRLHTLDYAKPGDELAQRRLSLVRIAERRVLPIDSSLYENQWDLSAFYWADDSSRFFFQFNQRGHQRLRIIAVDGMTGEAATLLDETSPTFIDYAQKHYLQYLDETNELIWMSERDGWNHLYRFDLRTGQLLGQITQGSWVVKEVVSFDQERRTMLLKVVGFFPEQDPYYEHWIRVSIDTGAIVNLTNANGTHDLSFAPSGKWIIDRWSRVDHAPVTELRSAETGEKVLELESADWSALLATGWQGPERFTSVGRDGATEIHGVIYRPSTFDPAKTWPVIEVIYAGPQGAFVPKSFSPAHYGQDMVELGFVVVQIDGMGTNWRSKAFHDVCWQNLGDSGFADRIAWLKAAKERYSYFDLERVGIFGGSAGGQSALRALLAHGDFYKAAVADCGCHDNRMDKIWWNELWMGWPIGPHYEEQSNVTQAHRLQGALMLVVGEMDRNVDPTSTLQVVDALIKADKNFDLLFVPGGGHGVCETPYGQRRRREFFVEHLQ